MTADGIGTLGWFTRTCLRIETCWERFLNHFLRPLFLMNLNVSFVSVIDVIQIQRKEKKKRGKKSISKHASIAKDNDAAVATP
jgi:hypothetical protein